MTTYKLTLEYDGSKFSGWQDQTNARGVQSELKRAAAELFGAQVDVQGAGRTDSGVHAVGQVAHLKMERAPSFKPLAILRELNERLPSSIAIVECELAHERFHARHSATSRAYFYQITSRKAALSKKFAWWVKEPLDLAKMQVAAALLPGRHDFTAFRALDKSKPDESTIVVVESAEIAIDDHLIVIRIEASHFLWKMVRRIVGTLVKVGLGEVNLAEFTKLLEGQVNPKLDIAAWTAPAAGLFLESVRYDAPESPAPQRRIRK
jgi:tRNA pseudouridine38-40 synthase